MYISSVKSNKYIQSNSLYLQQEALDSGTEDNAKIKKQIENLVYSSIEIYSNTPFFQNLSLNLQLSFRNSYKLSEVLVQSDLNYQNFNDVITTTLSVPELPVSGIIIFRNDGANRSYQLAIIVFATLSGVETLKYTSFHEICFFKEIFRFFDLVSDFFGK